MGAPVSGLPARAETGSLSIMVGGDSDVLELQRPVLDLIASKVVHVGKIGHGQLTKTFNNCIYNISVASMAEMLPLAAKLGLREDALIDVVKNGSGSSFGFNEWAPIVMERRFERGLGYPMDEAKKDLVNLQEMATAMGADLGPLMRGTCDTYYAALDMGLGASHKGSMVKVHEKRLGVTVGSSGKGVE